MPKDEFASLERRWRERPLFGPPRRRRPRLKLAATLIAVLTLVGLVAVQGPAAVERFARLVDSPAPALEPPDDVPIPMRPKPPASKEVQDDL
jgi:hypothetical protein